MHSGNINSTAPVNLPHRRALQGPSAPITAKTDASPRPDTTADEIQEPTEKSRANGVLRLLEAGHFKGVAAARLRMNFQPELEARGAAAQTESTRTAAADLQAGMAQTLAKATVELGEDVAAPLQQLFAEFDLAVGDALASEAASQAQIDDAVTDALAALQNGLAGITPADDASTPLISSTDGAPADVAMDEPGGAGISDGLAGAPSAIEYIASSLLDEINQLTQAYEASATTESNWLGVDNIVEPNGNGKAFDKFLEQYRMQLEPDTAASDVSLLVDAYA